jgi:hypothetical protein
MHGFLGMKITSIEKCKATFKKELSLMIHRCKKSYVRDLESWMQICNSSSVLLIFLFSFFCA